MLALMIQVRLTALSGLCNGFAAHMVMCRVVRSSIEPGEVSANIRDRRCGAMSE